MDKDALLNIILNDLGEIETMVKSFRGQGNIPSAFLDLTEKKMAHLMEEFALLKSLNRDNQIETNPQAPVQNSEDAGAGQTLKVTPIIEEQVSEPATTQVQPTVKDEVKEGVEKTTVEKDSVEESIVEKPVVKKEYPKNEVETTATENVKGKDNVSVMVEAKTEASIKTIGESFGGEKNSVNDFMAKTKQPNEKKTIKGKPIVDLIRSLSINDRFMFQRELFEGKAEVMNQTLRQVNQMPDLNSALSFIQSNFDWDMEQEAAKAFLSYIERKF